MPWADGRPLELLMRSCDPTLIAKMNTCTWDLESDVLTTAKEMGSNKAQIAMESAPWYKNAFADLPGSDIKTPALPPETLYNFDEYRLIKTIHMCNELRQPSAGSTPLRKNGSKIVDTTRSDEDSASSSSTEGLHNASANGEESSPASGEEVHGKLSVTDGG